jgi:hypothetical protein
MDKIEQIKAFKDSFSKQNSQKKCEYCSYIFTKKENYVKHKTSGKCIIGFIEKTADVNNTNLPNCDKIISNTELMNTIRNLAIRVAKLEKDNISLKNTLNIRQKKQIVEVLNTPKFIPNMTFAEWSTTIPVNQTILLTIFEYDLTEGIKNSILSVILPRELNKLPIQAFSQKPNTIYIYNNKTPTDTKVEWMIMKNEMLAKLVSSISRNFLKEFIKWQAINKEKIDSNDNLKDLELLYMMKINGNKVSNEKRCAEIKKWLYSKISQTIDPSMLIPEIV